MYNNHLNLSLFTFIECLCGLNLCIRNAKREEKGYVNLKCDAFVCVANILHPTFVRMRSQYCQEVLRSLNTGKENIASTISENENRRLVNSMATHARTHAR